MPSHYLKEMVGLILYKENSFQFNRFMEQPWEQKWRSLSLTYSWQKTKQKCLIKTESSREYGIKLYIDNVFSL